MQEIADQELPAAFPETVSGKNALLATDLSSCPNGPSHTPTPNGAGGVSLRSRFWTGWNLTPRVGG